jgi:hypothetical protein
MSEPSQFDQLIADIGTAAYSAARCPSIVQDKVINVFVRNATPRIRMHAAHREKEIVTAIRRLLWFGVTLIRDKNPSLTYWKLVGLFTNSRKVVDFVNEYRVLSKKDQEEHARRIGQLSVALRVEAEHLLENSRSWRQPALPMWSSTTAR